MLLFVNDADHCLAAREATLRERLLVRLRWNRLDRLLATGASPEGSALLALRAQQLVRPEVRQELGRTVKDMIRDAREPLPPRSALAAPAHQRAVRRYAEALEELASRLLAPAPVSAMGMARASRLIMDATGPLYYPSSQSRLDVILQEAVLALDPMRTW